MSAAGGATVYSPSGGAGAPARLLARVIGDAVASRGLAWRLAVRDISAQYRQSYLGYLWAFIMPLANTLVWIALKGSGVVRIDDTGVPYAAYVFSGTMVWQLLVEAVQSPLQQVAAARSWLTKLNFRREALITASLVKNLFSMAIKLAVLVPAILLLGVRPDWHLALVPLALLATILFGTGIGLLLSPLGMLYTDIGRAIPLVAQFAMYTAPVVFTLPEGGHMGRAFALNPATPLVLTARAWLTGAEAAMPGYFAAVALAGAALLLFGLVLFRITLPVLIERMSA